ncbi:DMSO reductase anchor subunit [Rhodobacter viridis]|uniref:DMSO reductase anchor subunit n=1 Tax=Rhodobacter viridis TaxID=1054202 RepID=A0A318U220_9RHOB|nr:DmsC/YnfH family molybdoenzyme membrane anchor subunit [Rhodobacter viridis]PYF12677.1 DMSO reductase anchor subunit [Rhodobacter viridis]
MRAVPSVILFTTLSGAGFGTLAAAGLGLGAGPGVWLAGYGLAGAGLIASGFHLAHPLRAPLAFRRWRTSWLSREAWAAVAALLVLAAPAASALIGGPELRFLGALGAGLCLATVVSTAMIYASLRAVPRWHHGSVPLTYLACAGTGGCFLTTAPGVTALACLALAVLLGAVFVLGDRRVAALGLTRGWATGLGSSGTVRSFELPRSGPSFITRELVERAAGAGSPLLRLLSLLLAGLAPAGLLLAGTPPAAALAVHLAGILLSRWLFFTEATHVAALFYRGDLTPSRP